MSLEIDFAAAAEGVATDARGMFTLVAVNPPVLIADQLPAQFNPVLVVVVLDGEPGNPVIVAGRTMTGRIEAFGPDDEVLFVAQMRQSIGPPPIPWLPSRLQIIAQVPFTATKPGQFRLSAHITVVGEGEEIMGEITAVRRFSVADAASLRSQAT